MNDEKKLGLEPAFPNNDFAEVIGMSKRFYAACMAMQGILANPNLIDDHTSSATEWVANHAFMQADELLKRE